MSEQEVFSKKNVISLEAAGDSHQRGAQKLGIRNECQRLSSITSRRADSEAACRLHAVHSRDRRRRCYCHHGLNFTDARLLLRERQLPECPDVPFPLPPANLMWIEKKERKMRKVREQVPKCPFVAHEDSALASI